MLPARNALENIYKIANIYKMKNNCTSFEMVVRTASLHHPLLSVHLQHPLGGNLSHEYICLVCA